MAAAQTAPYVLHNARIYTVNPAQPVAGAMAVQGGRVVSVGEASEVLNSFPEWPRLDAGGRTVTPGWIDAHAHLMGLGEALLQADLVGAVSKAETLQRLQAFAADLPDDAWLLGRGWDQNDWSDASGFPTAADLDAAFPDRPVWLIRIDGHAGWANTAAMKTAGVAVSEPVGESPAGGAVVAAADGTPTGVFVDAAMVQVAEAVPEATREMAAEGLRRALAETARNGLTGVHEAGVTADGVALYQSAIAQDAFPIRNYAMIGGDVPLLTTVCEEGPVNDPSGRLSVRSLKLYTDGALGSRGAALLEDYSDDVGNAGLLQYEPKAYRALVERAMACGLQVNTHAIGDRANQLVLDTYEAVMEATGEAPGVGRHRVEHAQILTLSDIPRFAALGVIASVQPTHATSDMPWAEDRLGEQRLAGAYAWRRLVSSGARLALGSDFPVEQVNPLLGFHAAVTRQDADNEPPGGWYGNQVLSREEALRGFTLDAAYAAFMEDEVGSLEPGKRADFVVFSQDIMTVPPEDLLSTEVVATYLDGEAIYEAIVFSEP